MGRDRGKTLAKAAFAKANVATVFIEGDYEDDRQKFSALVQDMSIEFDSNNNISSNGIKDTVDGHIANTSNPHGVDKTDVGLGSVDNKSYATIESDVLAAASKSDVGLDNVPNVDCTNASNISSGTLPNDRLSGYSGTITVITSVDFANETTTDVTITVDNGLITGVS